MQRRTAARIAGAAYLLYIGVAFPTFRLEARALHGATTAERLESLRQHVGLAHLDVLLSLASGLCAFALAISLYSFTRDEDGDIALLGLACRFLEGLFALPISMLTMLWLMDGGAGAAPELTNGLGIFMMKLSTWQVTYSAYLFAIGSTAFCYLLLRGRLIPTWLGWVGFVGSAIVTVSLPLSLIGIGNRPLSGPEWAPIAVFEIVVAFWFLYTGGERRPKPTRPM
jgi:hypothetical protein